MYACQQDIRCCVSQYTCQTALFAIYFCFAFAFIYVNSLCCCIFLISSMYHSIAQPSYRQSYQSVNPHSSSTAPVGKKLEKKTEVPRIKVELRQIDSSGNRYCALMHCCDWLKPWNALGMMESSIWNLVLKVSFSEGRCIRFIVKKKGHSKSE